MALITKDSGTKTATGSEDTLSTQTDAGVYVLVVDLNNLANGDEVVLRLKTKCKSGSTSRLAYTMTYANVQNAKNVYSVPVPVDTEVVATLEQTAGTNRNYDWNLLVL